MPDATYEPTESNVDEFFPTGNGADAQSVQSETEDETATDAAPTEVESGTPQDAESQTEKPEEVAEESDVETQSQEEQPTVTVGGKKMTLEEVEKKIKAAEEWQAIGTRRAMAAAEDRKAAEAIQTELRDAKIKLKEYEMESVKAQRPIEPEPPERPLPSDYLDKDDSEYEAALAKYTADKAAHVEAKRKYQDDLEEWQGKRDALRRAIDDLRTSTPKQPEQKAQSEAVAQEVQIFVEQEHQRNSLTQDEINRIWPKVLEAQHANPNRLQSDILRQYLYEEVYPARAKREVEVTQDVRSNLKARQEAAANASPGAQPTQATASGKMKTIYDVDDPDSPEAVQMIEKLVREHPTDWFDRLNEMRNQRKAAAR
jgi:hypothetical protein